MKLCLYTGNYKKLETSGMGKAILHQLKALEDQPLDVVTEFDPTADILHLNDWFPRSYLLAKRAKHKGMKVVYHAHSTEEDFRNSFRGSNLVAPLFKRWLEACYRLGDLVITPTPYAKAILQTYRLDRPILAISNGIDLSVFDRSHADAKGFRERWGVSGEEKLVVSVGHFIERKGIVDFIRLAKRHKDVRFIWFGYSPSSVLTREVTQAMKNKTPNISFPGYIDAGELRDAYAAADCFLFMTKEETEGIVLLEAMAMQVPVLIRDIPIYSEYEDGVSLYKAISDDEFDRKLLGILDQTAPSTVIRAYEEVRKRSIDKIGYQLYEAYRSVLNP